jgi:hypothetical protein
VPEGWESDSSPADFRNFSSSGRGAISAHHPEWAASGGEFGGGRGTDYSEPAPAIAGEDRPEFPREGWGEPGENYPPTQGPLGDRYRDPSSEGGSSDEQREDEEPRG